MGHASTARLLITPASLAVLFACGGGSPSDSPTPPPPAPVAVASVELTPPTGTLEEGRTLQLTAIPRDAQGYQLTRAVSWSSSNATVASVSPTGLVTALAVGAPVSITATVEGKQGSATVTVIPVPVVIITVSVAASNLAVGQTTQATAILHAAHDIQITGRPITWTSSSNAVATVTRAGLVTAVSPGQATITATADGKSGGVVVTVTAASAELVMCSGGNPTVLFLVQATLLSSISANLTRFANDLCADGYTVWRANAVPANPPAIRTYLADAWSRSAQRLTGAFLIGDIPHAYQFVVLRSANPNIPETREEAISFQYYSDLDGNFSASPGYVGAHNYSYDVHNGETDWELWIGVLPSYKGNPTTTVTALNRYFDKNHAYRTGGPKPPRAFLNVNEHFISTSATDDNQFLTFMRSGTYAWTPFSNAATARLYFKSYSPSLSLAQGYADLQAGVADFFVQDSHGFFGAGGQLTIASVETNPVNTIFFWSNGCAIGDVDRADNFLTSIVYSPTSSVLVGKGTTNNSGGMGNNQNGFFGHNVAVAMSAGASFGAAILSHVNVPLISPWSGDREFHYGTPILIGDPTLKLRP
jgi:hypothetical protein